jgi:predicted peptidase
MLDTSRLPQSHSICPPRPAGIFKELSVQTVRFAAALLAPLTFFVFCGADSDPAATRLYEAGQYASKGPDGQTLSLPYRLLKPKKIEAGKRYPLVLFLHGAGERGSENENQLKYLPTWLASDENREKYPCFVLAPQCPDEMKWADVPWDNPASQPLGEMSVSMRAVVGLLDDVVGYNPIDPARLYLTGLSMGGYGSWDLAERMPARFAALAPVCGGGDEAQAGRLVGLPTWAWHGDADTAVPVERSRRMIAAIKAAGGMPRYTELKDVGHDSWHPAYNGPDGVLPWLFEQSRSTPAASP